MLFFVVIVYDFFITFVRYKIIASATEGLVQQPLQRIWAFGLMEIGLVFGMIWQIRRMGLI